MSTTLANDTPVACFTGIRRTHTSSGTIITPPPTPRKAETAPARRPRNGRNRGRAIAATHRASSANGQGPTSAASGSAWGAGESTRRTRVQAVEKTDLTERGPARAIRKRLGHPPEVEPLFPRLDPRR